MTDKLISYANLSNRYVTMKQVFAKYNTFIIYKELKMY